MQQLLEKGLVKSLGVSNFSVKQIKEIVNETQVTPQGTQLNWTELTASVNQVELHPYLVQKELVDYCLSNGIEVEAYSPLGSGNFDGFLKFKDTIMQKRHQCCWKMIQYF